MCANHGLSNVVRLILYHLTSVSLFAFRFDQPQSCWLWKRWRTNQASRKPVDMASNRPKTPLRSNLNDDTHPIFAREKLKHNFYYPALACRYDWRRNLLEAAALKPLLSTIVSHRVASIEGGSQRRTWTA